MKFELGKRVASLAALFWLVAIGAAPADPVAELTSFSVFKETDLPRLEKGEVLSARTSPAGFPRGLSAQFCYIVPVPFEKAVELQKNFNPGQHPELKSYIMASSKRAADDFSKLRAAPNVEPVRALARATGSHAGLQLSAEEERSLAAFTDGDAQDGLPPGIVAFWSDLLRRRQASFQAGGLPRQAPYANSIRTASEFTSLLKENPKMQARFAVLTGELTAGTGNPALYWEMFDAEGAAALSLGASYLRQSAAGYQSLDIEYYATGGYYTYLSFVELWPVKSGGKPATLVWRSDILSSATVGNLRGMEKTIAGNVLIKDVRKNVAALLRDSAR